MKFKFHKVTGRNSYCGPTALSAITGVSRDDIAALARQRSGRRAICGMHDYEAQHVIEKLGGKWRYVRIDNTRMQKRTLQQWMDSRPPEQLKVPMLVTVTGHYVAVYGNTVVCSLQNGEPMHILSAKCRRWRFKSAIAIELPAKVELPKTVTATRQRQSAAAAAKAKMLREARRIADNLGLEIDGRYERGYYDISAGEDSRLYGIAEDHGLLADGEELGDMICDLVATTGLAPTELLDSLQTLEKRFVHDVA